MAFGPLSADACPLELTADTNNIRRSTGFHVDQDGTLRVRFYGDSAGTLRDLSVKGGVTYPYVLGQVVFSAGTVSVTKVWILSQSGKG
jgi:hypothetical protein